jgi:hypothetical protein
VQLDPNGEAVKVMDTSLPDLIPAPLAMPAGNVEPAQSLTSSTLILPESGTEDARP